MTPWSISRKTESNHRGCRCWAFKMSEINGTKREYDMEDKIKKRDIELESRGIKTGNYWVIDPRKYKHFILFVRGTEQW